ncbi:MAG: GTPase domain-containing protein [candidate division KSB1 bacterium]|nr:GTPase domain-containing protein [candidate division KSB1 bacterium]
MHIDWKNQEIIFKIVYYGPGLGGKTTNLEYIHSRLDPSCRSELISFKTSVERTLYFDFIQIETRAINGKRPRFNLYTVPGQAQYGFGRKLVLNGADALVFVADSQEGRMDDNLASLQDLEEKLALYGRSLRSVPWLIQYNKRDLPSALSLPLLQKRLNFFNVPYIEAVAVQGIGVMETLRLVIHLALQSHSVSERPERMTQARE